VGTVVQHDGHRGFGGSQVLTRGCWPVVAGALFAAGMVAFAPTAAMAADSTATAVVSSVSPSVFGQSVTFTATITDTTNGAAIPTGTVTFTIDASPAGAVSVNGSGQATFTTSTLSVGSHIIEADYASNSPTFLDSLGLLGGGQNVNQSSTTTNVVSLANPSVAGQTVTFSATVPANSPGAGNPTGSVNFSIDGGAPTTVPLQNNGGPVLTAQLTTSSLGIGTHSISATYNGDLNFTGSSGSLAGGQVVNAAPPAVTSISPNNGPVAGGTGVTITGTNFTGATSVRFGTTNATSYAVNSAAQITATAPAGTGTVDITVTTVGGTSATSAADQFSYMLPVPTITSVSPNTGPTTGGTAVAITGSNLTGTTAVRFGATNAISFTVTSASQISAIAPPGSLGTVDVTVKTSSGTSAISPADQYSYAVPADSVNLRKLQATVTPMAAQVWGQSTSGAIQSAVSEGFAGGGALISPSGNGVRINFSANPNDQQQQAADGTSRARNRFGGTDPFSGAYGSFDTNARGLAGPRVQRTDDGPTYSHTDDSFAALGYAGPVKVPPLRATEPKEWLGWAEIAGATLSRWSAPAMLGAAATTPSVYGDQVNFIAGLTRVLTPNFLVGVLGGWETFDYRSDAIQGRLTGTGWTTGAYTGWKLSSTVRFDAGLAYSGIGFDGTAGTASASFAGNRLLVQGGVTGNYQSYGFLIEPSARVFALWEHENAYTDTLGTAQAGRDFSTGRASTGIKVAYPFAWTSTAMLSPYAEIYGDYYFNTDNIVIPGAGALPVTPVFTGLSARADVGMSAQFASGGQFTVGGERSGLGGNFSLWTYRARASIPFGAK
jgi:Bacterial Ig-like domain (group 3)/Autotransporter beta-domain/IPT/TIG domain